MSGILKALEYSIRYIVLIILFYFLGLKNVYVLKVYMIAIIPINFLAIKYGILTKIKKDNYVDKYYILMSLTVFTNLFNIIFLYFMNVSYWVIAFACLVNEVELIYLDLPSKKVFNYEIVGEEKKENNNKSKKKSNKK